MQDKKGIGEQAKGTTMEGILQVIGHTKIDVTELAYKKMLLQISKMLDGCSLSGFKFLCEKQIPKRVREMIMEPTDLWQAMQERGLLGPDNLKFLKWMMKEGAENRTDLVSVVERYEREYVVAEEVGNCHQIGGEAQEESPSALEAKGMYEQSTSCPSESSLCGQMGDLHLEHHSGCGDWKVEARNAEPSVPQQVEQIAEGTHTGSHGLRDINFGSTHDKRSGINRADSDASTEDNLGEKEVDSEAVTEESRHTTEEVVGVIETADEAETKDGKCVVYFLYPLDVPKKLEQFYPKDVKQSENKRFLLGRGKTVSVKLNDEAISREQFEIKLIYSQSLKRYEMVLTNLSKIKTVTLDNEELRSGEQRELNAVSTLLINSLDIVGAVKFIIVVHLPQHFNGAEFQAIFKQDPDFYEHLASIQKSRPRQPIGAPVHPSQSSATFVPQTHPSAVNVQQGTGMLANSPPGLGHQHSFANPHQYLGFPQANVGNFLGCQGNIGPPYVGQWTNQPESAFMQGRQSNAAAAGTAIAPRHNNT